MHFLCPIPYAQKTGFLPQVRESDWLIQPGECPTEAIAAMSPISTARMGLSQSVPY